MAFMDMGRGSIQMQRPIQNVNMLVSLFSVGIYMSISCF